MEVKRILHHPFVRKHVSQGLKFAVCGAIGASIDLGTLTLLVEAAGMNPHGGFAISTFLAVVFVFLANKHFTFQNHEKKYAHQVLKFSLVYGCAVVFNISLSSLFFWAGFHYSLSKVLAIGIVAFWNYSLSHGFVFTKSEEVDTAIF